MHKIGNRNLFVILVLLIFHSTTALNHRRRQFRCVSYTTSNKCAADPPTVCFDFEYFIWYEISGNLCMLKICRNVVSHFSVTQIWNGIGEKVHELLMNPINNYNPWRTYLKFAAFSSNTTDKEYSKSSVLWNRLATDMIMRRTFISAKNV